MIQRLSICRTSERLGVTSGWVSSDQFRLNLLHKGLHYPLMDRCCLLLPVVGALLNKPLQYHKSVLITAQAVNFKFAAGSQVLQWKIKKATFATFAYYADWFKIDPEARGT